MKTENVLQLQYQYTNPAPIMYCRHIRLQVSAQLAVALTIMVRATARSPDHYGQGFSQLPQADAII